MKPILTVDAAVEPIGDGASLMTAGFEGCGNPYSLVDALLRKGSKDLTLIASDTAFPKVGVGQLVAQGRVKKLFASHIGTNPIAGKLMNSGEMEVTLIPQGTFNERIRAKGAGLGGILTPTGIGTAVETGKQKLVIDGQTYLLELPIGAQFAFIRAEICDKYGNCFLPMSTKTCSISMAMAADHVIVEAVKIVEPGELDPELVTIPGVFVSAIVLATVQPTNLQLQ